MDVYGKITKPFWDDRPVAIVGGGPSLVGFDFERLRGAHVLAVKGAIFNIPWADAGFGLDMLRYTEWRERLGEVQSRVYWAMPEDQSVEPSPSKNVTLLKRREGQQLSNDPSEIYGGGTSGFGAMQICIHKRAKQIILFGFDYDGEVEKDQKRREQSLINWKKWARHFEVYVPYLTQRGINVVNACPKSAIACFQKTTLDDGVSLLHREG
jgi:hypothetical protein